MNETTTGRIVPPHRSGGGMDAIHEAARTPLTKQDRDAILGALHAEPPMPSGPTPLAIERYEATVALAEARCESVANDLCTYVAMQDTTMELESFMFRCADKLRGRGDGTP